MSKLMKKIEVNVYTQKVGEFFFEKEENSFVFNYSTFAHKTQFFFNISTDKCDNVE